MNKEYKLKFEKLSLSTQAYSILCGVSFIYAVVSLIVSLLSNGASSGGGSISSIVSGLIWSIVKFLFSGNPVVCGAFCVVCLLLSIAGRYIDHQCIMATAAHGKVHYFTDYDLDSNGWVIFSVILSVFCTIVVVPKLYSWLMIIQYGHEMGIMTDYWGHEKALISSFQKIMMHIISIPIVILVLRQWIRMIVKADQTIVRIISGALSFPLYVAAALVICCCISELLAIAIWGAIVLGILWLMGEVADTSYSFKQANKINANDDWLAMEHIADEKTLRILANGPYKLSNMLRAEEELKKRKKR